MKLENQYLFFQNLAKQVLEKYKPTLIGILGTQDKAIVSEAIATVLKKKFRVEKNIKRTNDLESILLAVLRLEDFSSVPILGKLFDYLKIFPLLYGKKDYPNVFVFEIREIDPAKIKLIFQNFRFSMVILTGTGENSQLLKKSILAIGDNLKLIDQVVANGDDAFISEFISKLKPKVITYGFGAGLDISVAQNGPEAGKIKPILLENGQIAMSFKVCYKGNILPIRLPNVIGTVHIYSALASICVGLSLGINLVEMAENLKSYEAPPGRMKLLKGIKKTLIIDDSFDADFFSTRAAGDVVKQFEAPRKILVLGDILGEGAETEKIHRDLAQDIINAGIKLVFAIGPRTKFTADELRRKGFPSEAIFEFEDSFSAGKPLEHQLEVGDLVLIKGSRAMRLEKVVKEIMAEPLRAEELLVRR